MTKKILSELGGFTPVIDSVREEVGVIAAVVFGRMWLFCQMEDGVCKASLSTIADYTGLDKATVQRHAQKLCETGYLKDLSPDLRNRPHVYADTGKVALRLSLTTVAHSNTETETVAESNATVAHSNATVAESQLNRVSNRVSKRNSVSEAENLPLDWKIATGAPITEKDLENARRAKSYAHRKDFPEVYLPFADLYHDLTGQEPSKKNLADWLLAFADWQTKGLEETHIRQAHQKISSWATVTRPARLTDDAYAIKCAVKVAQGSFPPIFRAEEHEESGVVPNPYAGRRP